MPAQATARVRAKPGSRRRVREPEAVLFIGFTVVFFIGFLRFYG
jgi:hypothetical protein